MKNIALMKKVVAFLKTLPENQLDMGKVWGEGVPHTVVDGLPDVGCGTAGCVMGWTAQFPEAKAMGVRFTPAGIEMGALSRQAAIEAMSGEVDYICEICGDMGCDNCEICGDWTDDFGPIAARVYGMNEADAEGLFRWIEDSDLTDIGVDLDGPYVANLTRAPRHQLPVFLHRLKGYCQKQGIDFAQFS